jgi:hypothetical protein
MLTSGATHDDDRGRSGVSDEAGFVLRNEGRTKQMSRHSLLGRRSWGYWGVMVVQWRKQPLACCHYTTNMENSFFI